jgi:phage I-like protein
VPDRKDTQLVVAFAAAGGTDGISKPFEILHVGDFKRGTRSVPVSSADLDKAVENFNRWKSMGQEIPIDYDHAFAEGRESPAAGWYNSIERQGDALFATVKWNSKAREEIQSGAYRFFSPEFSSNYANETGDAEGFTILSGALTNRPFLRGMTPVALNQEVEDEIVAWAKSSADEYAVTLAEKLHQEHHEELERAADTRDVSDKNKTEKFTVKIGDEEKEFTAEEIVAMSQKAATADDEKARADKAQAEADANKRNSETLSTRVESLEKESKDRDFGEIFSQAQRSGRVDAKDETKTAWRETFDALGADKTKALIEQIPAETIPFTSLGSGHTPRDPQVGKDGVDPDREVMNQRVNEYLDKNPDASMAHAIAHVEQEMKG